MTAVSIAAPAAPPRRSTLVAIALRLLQVCLVANAFAVAAVAVEAVVAPQPVAAACDGWIAADSAGSAPKAGHQAQDYSSGSATWSNGDIRIKLPSSFYCKGWSNTYKYNGMGTQMVAADWSGKYFWMPMNPSGSSTNCTYAGTTNASNSGITDYMKEYAGACANADFPVGANAGAFGVVQNIAYTNWGIGYASCTTFYSAQTVISQTSSATGPARPGANCGLPAWKGPDTFTSPKLDWTAPSATFSVPAAGTTFQSATSLSVTWSEADTGGSGVSTRSQQRQRGTVVTAGSCSGVSWANDGTASTSVSPLSTTGLLSGYCYRWVQTLTDVAGNSSATTSGAVLVDTSAPAITWTTPSAAAYNTTGSITPSWTVSDPQSGVAGGGTDKRQYATLSSDACGASWTTEATQTNNTATTLTGGRCYRWTFDLALATGAVKPTNNAGLTTSANLTSAIVKVDTTAPAPPSISSSGARSYQDGNTIYFSGLVSGSLTITSTGSDAQSGIASSTFGALSATTGWTPTGAATVTGNPASRTYSWTTSAVSTSLSITTTNNAGLVSAGASATVTRDATNPTTDFTSPDEGATSFLGGSSYSVAWSETETGSDIASRSLQRQRAAVVTPGSCAGLTFTNDGTAYSGASPRSETGLLSSYAYRWQQTLTDNVGNSSTVTSGCVINDVTPPSIDFSAPDEGTTTLQNSTSYSVAWSESDTGGSGLSTRSLQRQRGAVVTAGSCAGVSWVNVGTASTSTSPVSVTGLLSGDCYRWQQTLTDAAGNSSTGTSGSVLVDTSAPAADFTSPDEGVTTTITSDQYTVAWSETETGSGIASRSLQRQKSTTPSADCATASYADDGSPTTVGSPVSVAGLSAGRCYRWVLSLTDNVGNASTRTSGQVAVDLSLPPPSAPDLDPASDTGFLAPRQVTATLRPNRDIEATGISFSSGTSAWPLIDEASLDTGDWVKTSGSYSDFFVGFPAPALGQPIDSMTVHANVTNGAPANQAAISLRQPSTGEWYHVIDVGQNAPASQQVTLATRPWDGRPWTSADIDALQAGAVCWSASLCNLTVRQLWVEVTYTSRSPAGAGSDDITADNTPSLSGTNDPAAAAVELYEGAVLLGSDSGVSDGTWQITSSLLAAGPHGLTAKAVSAFGTRSAASGTLTVTIDTAAPAVDLVDTSDTGPFLPTQGTLTLLPNRDVEAVNPVYSSGTSAWNLADDYTRRTGPADWFKPAAQGHVTVGFAGSGLGSHDAITSVTLKAWVTNPASSLPAELYLRDPSTGQRYNQLSVGQSFEGWKEVTLTARPWDGLPWTVADVDALQAGANYGWVQADQARLEVHLIYFEVAYVTLRENYGADGVTNEAGPTFAGPNSPTADRVELYRAGTLVGTDSTVSGGTWQITAAPAPADGTYTFTAKAFDAAGNLMSESPPLSVTIDTVGPSAAPSQPDLLAASDTGVYSDDNITDDRSPTFAGSGPIDALSVALFDGATQVATDTAVGDGYYTLTSWDLVPGPRNFTARAFDIAGNATVSSPLAATIVANLTALDVFVAPAGDIGAAQWISVVTVNEIGQPIDSFTGTVTPSSTDTAGRFVDGSSYQMTAGDQLTGFTARFLLGTPGTHTFTAQAAGVTSGTSDVVTVTGGSLDAAAPATAYQGVPFGLQVTPRKANGTVARQYSSLVTFASSDTAVSWGQEIGSDAQFTFSCGCDGKSFPVTLNTLGLQTVTVTDEWGRTDQVTVSVVQPTGGLDPVDRIDAVRYPFDSRMDLYITANAPFTVILVADTAVSGATLAENVVDRGFPAGFQQLTVPTARGGNIAASEWYNAAGHTVYYTNATGGLFARSVNRYERFSSVPNNQNFTAEDPGAPVTSWSVTGRTGSAAFCDTEGRCGTGSTTIRFTASEPFVITGVKTSFQGSIWDDAGGSYFVPGGTTDVALADWPYHCWVGPQLKDNANIWIEYISLHSRRQGRIISGIPAHSPTLEGQTCPPGGSGSPDNPQAWLDVLEGLFDGVTGIAGAVDKLLGDPVDTTTGALRAEVADFALGGLSPSLELQRSYRSDRARRYYQAGDPAGSGLFGPGWSSSFDWRVLSFGTAEAPGARVRGADGRIFGFLRRNDGSYGFMGGSSWSFASIAGGYELKRIAGGGVRFDTSGRLAAIFDPQGRTMSFAYDAGGALTSVTDAAGRTATVTTDGAGRITRIDLPDGRYLAYTYGAGRLATARDLAGTVLSYVSDSLGQITAVKQGTATLLANVYDGGGHVVRQTDAAGATSHFSWDLPNLITQSIGPRADVTTVCYSLSGDLHTVYNALDGRLAYRYDPYGAIVSITDELGGVTRLVRDGASSITKLIDPLGRTTTTAYDASARPTLVTDPAGSTLTVAYNADGLPTGATRASGTNSLQVAGYTYTAQKQPAKMSEPGGATTILGYEGRGYLVSIEDAAGRKTTSTVDARGFVSTVVGPLGNALGGVPSEHTTTLTYDAMGRVLTSTNPLGQTTSYTYDAFGRLLTETSPLGFTTTYAYDAAGRVTSSTRQVSATVNAVTRFEYDVAGNLTAIVDAEDRRTEFTYDLLDRVTAMRDAAGKTWSFAYDANGRRTSVTDPTGRTTSTSYDLADRVVSTRDAGNHETTYAYDSLDRLLSVTAPLGRTTSYGYDWLGRRTSLTDALSRTTGFAYSNPGDLTAVTDALNRTTSFQYNPAHQLTKVVDALLGETLFGYDAGGRLTSRQNARGYAETYVYDKLDRLTKVTDPLGKAWQTGYDADGRVSGTTDAKNQATSFTYDRLGDLLTITPAGGPAIGFGYDKTGRRLSMSDGSGDTDYAYSPTGLLAAVTRGTRTVGYAYDDAGRISSVTYPGGGGTVSFAYDAEGRLATLNDWAGRATSYNYDGADRVTGLSRPGGLTTTIGYDALDRPTSIAYARSGSNLLSLASTYDAVGNVLTYADDTGTASFVYDALDRLREAHYPGAQDYLYAYDAAGNLLSATTPAGTRSYGYDAADRITSAGPAGPPQSTTRGPSSDDAGWTDSANGSASDDLYATASPPKNQTTTVVYGSFGLDGLMPAGAVVDAVTVTVEWKVDTTASDATLGSQAYVNGVAVGTEFVNVAEPTADTVQSYSVPGLTRADLLDGVFTVRVRASRGPSNTAFTASLDAVQVQVDWHLAGAAPSYDDNGAVLSEGTYGSRAFSYDALGRLVGVSGPGLSASYTLDGEGNRVAALVNGATTSFDLDVRGLPTVLMADGRKYLPGAPEAGYDDGTTWWNGLTTAQGSLLGHVDLAGTQTAFTRYDPHGGLLPGSPSPGPIGYTGEWSDATGLLNLRARAYDPTFARFLNRDSFGGFVGLPATGNRYAYALGNPLRYTDPSGHLVGAILADPRLVASIGLQMIPGIGDAYSLLTGAIGSDPIAGIELNDFERGIAIASAVTIGGGFHLLGRLDAALPGLRAGDAVVPGGARVGRTLDEFTPAGRRAISNAPPRGPPRVGGEALLGRGATRVDAPQTAVRGGAGPVRQGAAGVERTIADLEASGGRVLGREITIEAGGVRTRPDLFVELPNGQQVLLEVKTGASATLTPNQATAFPQIWWQGGIARGANAAAAGLTPGAAIRPTRVWVVRQPWPLWGPL